MSGVVEPILAKAKAFADCPEPHFVIAVYPDRKRDGGCVAVVLSTHATEADADTFAKNIAALTEGANSVTFLPLNEEASSKAEQIGVECCGDWTDWKDRRFMAETHIEAVATARATLSNGETK